MFSLRCLTRLPTLRTNCQCIKLVKNFHDEFTNDSPKPANNPTQDKIRTTSPAVASKFNVYTDDKATVIFDIDEERQRISETVDESEDLLGDAYSGLNLESKILPLK